jgi:hypothetical protein
MQITASCSIQSATTGFTAYIFPYRSRVSLKEAFEGLEPDEAKVSRPVLRGLGPSNGVRLLGKPTSKNGKGLTCWKRFGVLALFAISGMNNADSARCAIQKSPASQAGACITASPV